MNTLYPPSPTRGLLIRSKSTVAWFIALLFIGSISQFSAAQVNPSRVQQELENRGMTVEEARREAIRLGIDLTDPVVARQRARSLGVSEDLINQMLGAVEDETSPGMGVGVGEQDRSVPVIAGRPLVSPGAIKATNLETFLPVDAIEDEAMLIDSVLVRVPLMDEGTGISDVDLFFYNEMARDTLYTEEVRRVLGSKYEGTWEAIFYIYSDVSLGEWNLYVFARDEMGNDNIIDTNEPFLVSDQEIAQIAPDSVEVEMELTYFGYDLFELEASSFLPTSMGPVDEGYLVGPGDHLRLLLFGSTEFQHDLVVDNEGRIFVPEVGQRTVAGSRLNSLRDDLRIWLARSYAGLMSEPPEVLMDLSVTRLRPVEVFVLGEVDQPGRFSVPSNSTVFNALYSVGGPRETGSLRSVQVIRFGEIVHSVDLYDYLLRGYSVADVRLRSNDHVFIPARGKTVSIEGEIQRPAYYELREGEGFSELLEFAGGLNPEAYTERFQVERVIPFSEREDPRIVRRVLDYDLREVLSGTVKVDLADGDEVTIFSIPGSENLASLSRVQSVFIDGAVFNPGRYQLSDSLTTVRSLIEQANGLTGDAHFGRMELIRLTDQLRREVISLNLNDILEDIPTQNLVLKAQDSIRVFSNSDLEMDRFVTISGQVQNGGTFQLLEGMTLSDLLFKAGGLTDSEFLKEVFVNRADLFRKGRYEGEEFIIPFHLGDALLGSGMGPEKLQPGDEIRIYPIDVEVVQDRFVTISGAVKREGKFKFRDGMTLEDLVLQAGGFSEGAYLQEIEVARRDTLKDSDDRGSSIMVPLINQTLPMNVTFGVKDSLNALLAARLFALEHRDRVFIRTNPDFEELHSITLGGEIRFPGNYALLRENETLADLITRAGGVLPTAYPKGGRLTRDNLQVIVEMEKAINGNKEADIVLLPGDEVYIPPQPNTVAVRGNVANEGLIKYEPGRRVSYYLKRAGGVRPESELVLLTQASGATFRVRRGLFRSNPVVDEGARIMVTRKPPKEPGERIDIGRTVVESIGIISSAMTIVVLARQAFNN